MRSAAGCAALGVLLLLVAGTFDAEPFYDPNIFLWANEIELTMRLLDRGMRHLFLPEVVSVHQKPLFAENWTIRTYRYNQRHWAYAAGRWSASGRGGTSHFRTCTRMCS